MAKSKTKDLRELYGNLLGEDLVQKLTDDQINLLSEYYNSLTEKEKDKINDAISEGKSHDLLEIAEGFLQESEEDIKPKTKKRKTKVKKTKDTPPQSPPNNVSRGNGGGDKPSASVKYEGTNDEDLVDEEIDERILKILGLEDSIGFDYGDYKTLLREKLTELDIKSVQKPKETSETQSVLIDEFKRIKSKTGRFKVKSVKKISADKFIPKATFSKPKEQYLLTNSVTTVDNQEEDKKDLQLKEKSSLLDQIIEIKRSVDNILSLLSRQNNIMKKQSESERLDKERRSKRKKEDSIEKIKTSAKGIIKEVIAPVQGILDKIINFFVWVILGRAVTKFLEWARDPQNKSKVEALGNLLKTFWPAILGALVLFTTPLGKLIRFVVGTVTKLTFQLLRKGIPALTRFLKNRDKNRNKVTSDSDRRKSRGRNSRTTQSTGGNPKGRVTGRGGLLGFLALEGLAMATPFLSEKVGEIYSNLKIGDAGLSDEDLLKEYQREKSNIDRRTSGPLGDLMSQRTDYSRLDGLEDELNRRGIAYKGGGEIFSGVVTKNDGIKFSGAGQDTQAFPILGGGTAVLKPKELVLNEEQQKQIYMDTGRDPRSYVADSRPKPVGGKMLGYSSGGMIGGVPQGPHTPLPSPGYVRPEGSFIPRPNLRGMPGPTGKPMPWGFNPFQGLKGGGPLNQPKIKNIPRPLNGTPEIDAMRLGGSLINIGPIDTNLPRPMTGFRDLAEVQYQNNRGVKGFEGGGKVGQDKIAKNSQDKGAALSGNYKLAYNMLKTSFPTAKPFHIAGAIGNFDTEAPGLKPNTYQFGGGPGRGIAQWETPGRWDTAIKRYGPGVINSLPQQLQYVKYELDTGNPDSKGNPQLPYGRKTKGHWLSGKNLTDATIKFMNAYEAPSIPHLDRRIANANKIMASANTSNSAPKPKAEPTKPKSFMDNVSEFFSDFGSFFGQGAVASPNKKQGGGELRRVEQKADKLIGQNFEQTYADYMEQVENGFVQPMSPEDMQREIEKQKRNKKMEMIRQYFQYNNLPRKKQGGGSITPITTNFGIDIPGGKMGADTQYWPQENVALQPGEEIFKYVVTKDAAEKGLGERLLSFADQQQKLLDSNSTSSNIVKNVNRNIPGPRKYKSNGSKILPPIEQKIGSKGTPTEKNGSSVPSFPIVSPYSKRSAQMATYGILSVG